MEAEKRIFVKYMPFVLTNLIVAYVLLNRYGVLSYLGLWMIIATHELGHYLCAVIKKKNPQFTFSSKGGNFGVRYSRKVGESALLIKSGGMLLNFLFLPLFLGMGIMNAPPVWLVLMILGGSISDILGIIRVLRG